MNIPNLITASRIFLIPILVIVYYLPFPWSRLLAVIIFAIAGISDWIDGYLARTLGQSTKLGEFLDPVADKLLISTALVLIVADTHIPYLSIPVAVIIGREIAISALREWMAEIGKRTSIAVGYVGKVKTTVQIIAVLLLLYYHPPNTLFAWLGGICLYSAAILTLWSMVMYLKTAWPDLALEEHKY